MQLQETLSLTFEHNAAAKLIPACRQFVY